MSKKSSQRTPAGSEAMARLLGALSPKDPESAGAAFGAFIARSGYPADGPEARAWLEGNQDAGSREPDRKTISARWFSVRDQSENLCA
jgi:hypothetical protein